MELLCYINILFKYGKQCLENLLADLQLNMQELIVILVIHHSAGILQSRLVNFTGYDKGNFSKFLKKLEEKDYIYRCESQEFPGQKECFLTEEGQALVPELMQVLQQWEAQLTEGIAAEELATFHEVESTISENLFDQLGIKW